ncbi:hypothetical protein [Sphingobacterium sp. E70]|uniref:hypothetical protein n=1 Tax=Sphingobacterium sp. E70 TaxID=2853439 RepID=UPI00211C3135|nr:hypothetical protein [Sphingobacterium sp. E70]
MYKQILSDLDEAEKDLPENYSTALLNTTRAHKNTARAFKTRVYLTINNYAKVLEEAKRSSRSKLHHLRRSKALRMSYRQILRRFLGAIIPRRNLF